MTEFIKNDIIDNDNYKKYLEEVKRFYKLKRDFYENKQSVKKSVINLDSSLESKKKILAKKPNKCINCKRVGGTFFQETNRILKAKCGNIENPCDLNIEIIKFDPMSIISELLNTNISLKKIKKDIVITKLNFLFNYIEEDKAVELFDEYKSKFNTIQENYNKLYYLYNSIVNNEKELEVLKEKNIELNNMINKYNDYIDLYKNTNDKKYIKDAIEIYITNIKNLDNDVMNLKYKHNYIEENDDFENTGNIKLVQKKYDLIDFEIIKKPQIE
tara:strand:+ start:1905 stop:2720 length:816 start_codon:yes stop_codon:yes gene_type:complete